MSKLSHLKQIRSWDQYQAKPVELPKDSERNRVQEKGGLGEVIILNLLYRKDIKIVLDFLFSQDNN